MTNRISERIADFLKRYPPFNELSHRDLAGLALEVEVLYKEKGGLIFSQGEATHRFFYVVHKGAVDLRRPSAAGVVDICDEGDIFGLRPLMAGENYQLQARTREESILYAIPITSFKPFIQSYEEIGGFLLESFASNTRNPYSKKHGGQLIGADEQIPAPRPASPYSELLPLTPNKNLVTCGPGTPARDVASLMTEKGVGSVLVMENDRAIGIITDKDLRNQVVAGRHPKKAPATDIMTRPVVTYPKRMTVTQAHLAMMKNHIGHLCLTEDGTPNSSVVGIVSKYDLMLAMGNNPEVLMRAIKRTRKVKKLKPIRDRISQLLQGYLDHNIPMSLTMKVISELNDACLKKVIALCLKKEGTPPSPFAWLTMGSQGRGEQMLHTDQDNALLFKDVIDNKKAETKKYFLNLASRVNQALKRIGYEYCPAEMMASNPEWCLSLNEWKVRVAGWMGNPGKDEVLLSSIFFDYNLGFGKTELVGELSDFIFDTVEKHPVFYNRLAAGALQNPSPTGFFRQFLVEQDGKYKDFFDLKHRALMPLTDAARVLILSHHIKSINSTPERFEKLAELEPNNRELFLSCSYAAKALLKFRTKQGLAQGDSGRFIALDQLSKEEKVKLKRTFRTIEELQELITLRFKVSNSLV